MEPADIQQSFQSLKSKANPKFLNLNPNFEHIIENEIEIEIEIEKKRFKV